MIGDIPRLPTRFGSGHSDMIAFLQDVVVPMAIENKFATLVVRGILENGDEVQFTLFDDSGHRPLNQRMLGILADLQMEWIETMREAAR